MNGKTSTPREFLESLKSGVDFRQPVLLRGMTKVAADDDEALMFARGPACTNWVKIPLAMIETIETLRMVPCKDHAHPLVVLRLKEPQTDEGRFFLSLLQSGSSPRPQRRSRVVRGPRSTGAQQRRGGSGPVAVADADFPWCETIPEYDVDADGNVWCLDYCWESEQQAVYNPC